MIRNGLCPFCYLKRLLIPPKKAKKLDMTLTFDNEAAPTPPMGWSSWNTFRNTISQELIFDTALALKNSGLLDAGYEYINIDDNWVSSTRDDSGSLVGDLTRFSNGIEELVNDINNLGIKVGIYSSNGSLTCEDLPASLYSERKDANTIASWGIEYFKYDFCHNEAISKYTPLISGITLSKLGEREETVYPISSAKLMGGAKLLNNKKVPSGQIAVGLDKNCGIIEYTDINVDEAGEYVLNLDIYKKGRYRKFIIVEINGDDYVHMHFPGQSPWIRTARFQTKITLNEGKNSIRMYNPVRTKIDSAILQYKLMGKYLNEAAANREKITQEHKPIIFSICEWGFRKPWLWGRSAGNLWRTTPDIRPRWLHIMLIYERNVKLHQYSEKGAYNDPDMLEVGNGKLTQDENFAHFAAWCMMNAPLILGNDLRSISPEILDIVTNPDLIQINQDSLVKQAKRIKKGRVDILAKPLSGNRVALCFLNKYGGKKKIKFEIGKLKSEEYLSEISLSNDYIVYDLASKNTYESKSIEGILRKHSAQVFIIKNK